MRQNDAAGLFRNIWDLFRCFSVSGSSTFGEKNRFALTLNQDH